MTLAAIVLALKTLAGGVAVGFLTNWLTAPDVPPLRLPIPLRYVPGVRQPIEAVCKGFFYIGAKCGFDVGFILGILLALFLCACWWSFTAYLRSRAKSYRQSVHRNNRNHQSRCHCNHCSRVDIRET